MQSTIPRAHFMVLDDRTSGECRWKAQPMLESAHPDLGNQTVDCGAPPSFQPCREFMDQNKPKSTVKKSTHPLTETHMGNTVPEANATELFLSFDHRRFPHRPRLQRLGHGHPPTTAKPTPTPTGPPTKFTLLNKLFPGHLCGQEILGASPKMLAHVLGNRTGRVKTCEEAGATSSKMPP